MDAVETPPVPPVQLGRLLLSRLDAEAAAAIVAAVRAELATEVFEAAVQEARAQLASEYADKHEAQLDDLDRQRRQIEKDAAAVADAEADAQLKRDEETFAERLDDLRTRLRDWRSRAETAEAAVTGIMMELCGGLDAKPVWLYSGGHGLRTLHKGAVNAILGRGGVQLRSKTSVSERKVVVRLDDGKTAEHTQFWLTKAAKPGVVDPADAEAEEG